MISKKTFLIFVILLFFSIFANAIVVQDISKQIEQGNKNIIENNAIIESNVSQIKKQVLELDVLIREMKADSLDKNDISIIRANVDQAMIIWQQQLLIMFLILIFFSFTLGIYGRSKRWF